VFIPIDNLSSIMQSLTRTSPGNLSVQESATHTIPPSAIVQRWFADRADIHDERITVIQNLLLSQQDAREISRQSSTREKHLQEVHNLLEQLSKIIRKPEERLVAEVSGSYAGLAMLEDNCIKADAKLAREAHLGTQPEFNDELYGFLRDLHRSLLHEHEYFYLAIQHPSATQAVRSLAIEHAMPERLWRHGIHSFLEVLRKRSSPDHMLEFIYLAYSKMTLLVETVPAFKETWIECLVYLGRYRVAIIALQKETVASELAKVEGSKPAKVALGQEVGNCDVAIDVTVVKPESKEGPDVVEGHQEFFDFLSMPS
jgi:hypothetical protein